MIKPDYSIVIPVYNAENTLIELSERLVCVCTSAGIRFEIIFIDDHSLDQSWDVLKTIRNSDKRVKIIHLSKNCGQHNAILCGLQYARGERVIIMDDDLQNPPEEIPKLVQKIDEGYDVVFGKFTEKKHGFLQKKTGIIYHKLLHRILEIPDTIYLSNFVILSSQVRKNILSIKSSYSFLIALITKSTPPEKIANIEVIHNEREFGSSNYNLLRHIRLFSNLIINHSSIPLKIIAFSGGVISILSICYAFYLLINKIWNPSFGLEGWNSLMVATTFLGGLTLLSLAIIGEYLRRILVEVMYSLPYVIGETRCDD